MTHVLMLVRRFALGVMLIIAAIAILLWSDPKRIGADKSVDASTQIAVVTYASIPVLEEGVRKQQTAALMQSGRSILIGNGLRKDAHRDMRSPPSLWDEIVISEGHLTSEQMQERLAALLKP